jgi:hypothetical protein
LKERLRRLEESIESSNKNVKELNESFAAAHAKNSGQEKPDALNEPAVPEQPPKHEDYKEDDDDRIAMLVIACNRPEAADSHLKQLIERREKSGKVDKFPIIVSQDCDHDETARAIEKHRDQIFAFVKVKLDKNQANFT